MNTNSLRAIAVALSLAGLSACQTNEAPTPPPPKFTLTVVVSGGGSVTYPSSTGATSTCTSGGGSTCTDVYNQGTVVTLTEITGTSWDFGAWSGCTPNAAATMCTVTMSADRVVTASFIPKVTSSGVGDMFVLTRDEGPSKPARLLSFASTNPGATLPLDKAITGLDAGDAIIAIDFRPSSGQLYGVARTASGGGNLYVIDRATAVATKIIVLNAPTGTFAQTPGVAYDMAFQPFDPFATAPSVGIEYIRLLEDAGGGAGNIFTINPNSGDTSKASNAQAATGVAFTNAFRGTRSTTAYTYSSKDNILYKQTLPKDATQPGTLSAVGPAGSTVPSANGLVINGANGVANAVFNVGTTPTLFDVNLGTGALTNPRQIGSNTNPGYVVADLAIVEPLEPIVYGICTAVANTSTTCNDGVSLYTFKASDPTVVTYVGGVTGLGAGEKIIALAATPPTGKSASPGGQLYALTDANKVYQLDPVSGAATAGVTVTGVTGNLNPVGANFDPATGLLRLSGGTVDGSSNTNIAVNVTTGASSTFNKLNQAPFSMVGVAFGSNTATPPPPAPKPTYYGLDASGKRLYTIDSSTGPTGTPGQIKFSQHLDFTPSGGFEIVGALTAAYSLDSSSHLRALTIDGSGNLTGASTDKGAIGLAGPFVGTTVNPAGDTVFVATTGAANGATEPRLVSFAPASPGTVIPPVVISGMTAGDKIVAMHIRAQNGALYALAKSATGNGGRLYTVTTGGAATPVGSGNLTLPPPPPNPPNPPTPPSTYPLNGALYSMAVDPSTFNLRIVSSDLKENLSVDPTTGVVTKLGTLAETPAPVVTAAAFTRNFANSSGSVFYLYDAANSRSMVITDTANQYVSGFASSAPDNGTSDPVGFSIIGGHDGLGLITDHVNCVANPGSNCTGNYSTMYSMDLTTGAVTDLKLTVGTSGSMDSRLQLRAMAIRFP